jgi:hypothetical protein
VIIRHWTTRIGDTWSPKCSSTDSNRPLYNSYWRTSRKGTNNNESRESHGVWEVRTVYLKFPKFAEAWCIACLILTRYSEFIVDWWHSLRSILNFLTRFHMTYKIIFKTWRKIIPFLKKLTKLH